MTECHDPYRELELYLQKAQEEIGIAVKELEEHQETAVSDESSDWNISNATLVLPPRAFRSQCDGKNSNTHSSEITSDKSSCVNRVCYDGNLLDNEKLSPKSNSPGYSHCQKSSFFSNLNPGITGRNGGTPYSPNTRRRLWRMHPSISFPETSKDLLMLGRDPSSASMCNKPYLNGYSNSSSKSDFSSRTFAQNPSFNYHNTNYRQRSNSDTVPPRLTYNIPEELCPYPRPPSGDVNLLSIWADNLVLELDKSLSGELNSPESYSPSSDYSLSPTKQEATSEGGNYDDIHFTVSQDDKSQSLESSNQSLPGRSLKGVSVSPDSGIEHVLCDTPEMVEDSVDSAVVASKKGDDTSCDISEDKYDTPAVEGGSVASATIPERRTEDHECGNVIVPYDLPIKIGGCVASAPEANGRTEVLNCGISNDSCNSREKVEDCVDSAQISRRKVGYSYYDALTSDSQIETIAPPHQFEDKVGNFLVSIPCGSRNDRSQATQTDKSLCSKPSNLKRADLFSQAEEVCLAHETAHQEAALRAHGLASEAFDLKNGIVVRTVCAVSNDHSLKNDENDNETGNYNSILNHQTGDLATPIHNRSFYSLPKSQKVVPNGMEKYNTLPKDSGKYPEDLFPQRSVSQSDIYAVRYLGIDELAEFMRQVKSNSYQLPSCADVSTDVKDDKENRDAITQTSPAPLSRSSSFTWVTDCDCSDWDGRNLNSASDDESLALSSCSNCKAENGILRSSSSSLAISSDDDEGGPASPGSDGSSSLYLSACSGSSDSFEEATITTEAEYEESKLCEDGYSMLVNRRPSRSSETTLRGSTLGDISEEQVTSETISMKSTISNPSIDSNVVDPLEQSASFPSTLKLSRKNRPTGSPAQPIEPTVLIINDLNLKSVSAPVLLRQKRHVVNSKVSESSSSDSSPPTEARSKDTAASQVPARAHSAKELNELQAIEACSWLRAAGFPQYAQMYEDNQFPIDVSIVQKDHAFLHPDSIQSLFRRLSTLNRCAKMKFKDHVHRTSLHMEESDDEEQYALSENWEFQRSSRRWSRIPSPSDGIAEFVTSEPPVPTKTPNYTLTAPVRKFLSPEEAYCSSHDSVFIDDQHSSPDSVRRSTVLKNEKISVTPSTYVGDCSPGSSSGSGGTLSLASEDMQQERRSLRRSGSDRVKEGAKALLKRMESLKGKRKKKILEANKIENVTITHSGTDGSSSSSLTSSPQFRRSQKHITCTPESTMKKHNTISYKGENLSTHSDTECRLFLVSERWKDANSNDTKHVKHYITSQTSVTVTSPQEESNLSRIGEVKKGDSKFKSDSKKNLLHPGSHNSIDWEDWDKRGSYYDNVCAPLVVFNDLFTESLGESESNSPAKTGKNQSSVDNSNQNQEDGDIIIVNNERRDSGVGSSLTRGVTYQQAPWHCFPFISPPEPKILSGPVRITDLTAPQILLLRKLSLLKLTTIMEKFSPSSRTGWSWGVSKFICRIRNPDYKDKVVFGVPLLLILQRTGQPLPVSIQAAIHHLRSTALDSTGLFRKSGVRSRIQKLKSLNETIPEKISYEEQQAYDVADMLKQYFRELPEALLTNKLSETFISIFQFVPEDLRLEAIHAALMLMPDENREVLQSLLEFLHEVCQHSGVNQMTATNLAVCFAPSLFHLSTPRSASSSPRRRKTVGVPDLRELNENRAAYECLSCMVTNYKTLFTVSEEIISQSRIFSASYSQPATLEDLFSFASSNGQTGVKGFIDSCIQMFLKETKEKYKGWKTVSQTDHVDLSYKKLVDGHPLKLWKVSTEVEAPPVELLNRILRERHLWDNTFSKGRLVTRLNKQTDVIQYLSSSLPPHPPCDFCILRSWRTDLPKGACILVETSVEHPDAEVPPGSVRGIILSSRYLIEPCGSGKSRITHISRVDTRGRSPEWYNRAYGHICTLLLVKLRNSFSRSRADGPETKV